MSAESVAQDQIRAFVERIERLDEELKAINDDKKEIYAEAKGNGFDVVALKQVIKLRRQDANERMEREAIVELYMAALGMIATPDFDEPRVQVQARVREATESAIQKHDAEAGEITEPQPLQPAGQADSIQLTDGGLTPSVESGVAEISTPIQPETAAPSAEPEKASAKDGGQELSVSSAPASAIEFEDSASDAGQAPSTINADGGVLMETAPFRPVTRPHYHEAFPEVLGEDFNALVESIREEGVREPIIRMGDVILDGWARYNAARQLGIAYPVQDYSGHDPLLDVVQRQRRARQFSAAQERAIAGKLAKAVPHRADEIMELFGLAEELEPAE